MFALCQKLGLSPNDIKDENISYIRRWLFWQLIKTNEGIFKMFRRYFEIAIPLFEAEQLEAEQLEAEQLEAEQQLIDVEIERDFESKSEQREVISEVMDIIN